MPLPERCKINSIQLNYWFKYRYIFKKRLSIEDTYNDRIIQTQTVVTRDQEIEWEYPYASIEERELFKNLYLNLDTFSFTDYDNNTKICILIHYEEEERQGYYFLKGRFMIYE